MYRINISAFQNNLWVKNGKTSAFTLEQVGASPLLPLKTSFSGVIEACVFCRKQRLSFTSSLSYSLARNDFFITPTNTNPYKKKRVLK